MKLINADKCVVFFDFDNTIATCDVFDSMLPRFSQDDFWKELEKKWKKGKIGSRACLEGQVKGMSLSRDALDKYLASVKIEPYFKKVVQELDARGIKMVILSDNFDYILTRILYLNGVRNLKIYSNKLSIGKKELMPRFPYTNKNCHFCAHCKTKNLLANVSKESIIVYIGDGRSDVCPSQYADLVFAKDDLLKHFKDQGMTCFSYNDLRDVYNFFRRSFV